MKHVLVMICLLGGMPIAEADYRVVPGKRVDLSSLTTEFKRVVPTLEGCNESQGTVTCRRLSDDFTDVEKTAMDAALAVHDPDVNSLQRRAQRQAAAQAKLKALGIDVQDLKDALGQ